MPEGTMRISKWEAVRTVHLMWLGPSISGRACALCSPPHNGRLALPRLDSRGPATNRWCHRLLPALLSSPLRGPDCEPSAALPSAKSALAEGKRRPAAEDIR